MADSCVMKLAAAGFSAAPMKSPALQSGRLAAYSLLTFLICLLVPAAHAANWVATATGTVYGNGFDQSNTSRAVFGPPGSLAGKKFTLVFTIDDTKGAQTYLPDPNGSGLIQQSTDTGTGKASAATATLTIGAVTVSFGTGSISGITSPTTRVFRDVSGPLSTQISLLVQDNNTGQSVDRDSRTNLQMSIYHVGTSDGDWRTATPVVTPATPNTLGYFYFGQYENEGTQAQTYAIASGSLQIQNVTIQGLVASPLSRRICFNGADITQSSHAVLTGQPIQLTAGTSAAPCRAASNLQQSWTVCGNGQSCNTTISGYTATAQSHASAVVVPLCLGKLTSQCPTIGNIQSVGNLGSSMGPFYWTTQGTQMIDYEYTLPNGTKGHITANFYAAGPQDVSVQGAAGNLFLQPGIVHPPPPGVPGPPTRGTWLSLMDAAVPDPSCGLTLGPSDNTGLILCAHATQSPPGYFFWAQLIDDNITKTDANGSTESQVDSGLDTCYAYDYGGEMDDAPESSIRQGIVHYVRDFTARSYLMWKADPLKGSIAVPLGYVLWGFHGEVSENKSGDWYISGSSVDLHPFAPGSNYPLWSQVPVGATPVSDCKQPPPGRTPP